LPVSFPDNLDPDREALLDVIEAHLKLFGCYLMVDPEDDQCWYVDVTRDEAAVVMIRDLDAFARAKASSWIRAKFGMLRQRQTT
jgi:hypothetical protein